MVSIVPGRLDELADLIRRKNAIDADIAAIVGRPAQMGHVGEHVAAEIFWHCARAFSINEVHRRLLRHGSLGGPVSQHQVVRETGGVAGSCAQLPPGLLPSDDRTQGPAMSSRGGVRPWLISHVFLFESTNLYDALDRTGSKIGVATSVRAHLWAEAELFPEQRNPSLPLTSDQRNALLMFS